MPMIIVNNVSMTFEPKSLSHRVSTKIMQALAHAYMGSYSIASSYTPVENTDRARYLVACKLVLDNLANVADCEAIRNACLERIPE